MRVFLLFIFLFSFLAMATSFQRLELTATSTSSKILDADASRTYLLIQNKGADDLYLKVDSAHSGSEGIKILAGGNYEPFKVPANAIYVKSASNPDTISVFTGR